MAKRNKGLKIPEGTPPVQAFVQILDPATGTGTFLVEVIDLIHNTMAAKWRSQGHGEQKIRTLWNEYVPKHLLPRLHGYELLMAPYAIAHLKIGLKLFETGYHFESDERAQVYLTNALEPAGGGQLTLDFLPALAHEAEAVNEVKRKQRFTVVVGNPPYSVSSWNNGAWILKLTEDYKRNVRSEESQIQSLSNDYIKFIRLGQWCVDSSDIGILALITGHGYLHGTQARDLRLCLSRSFSRLFLLDLHGSVRRSRSEATVDEPVFEIMTGVAICLAVRSRTARSRLLGQSSQRSLTGALASKFGTLTTSTVLGLHDGVADHFPAPPVYSFAPASTAPEIAAEYQAFMDLPSCFGTGNRTVDKEKYWATGMASQQDDLAISFSATEVEVKLRALTESESYNDLRRRYRLCTTSQWSYEDARVWARTNEWRNSLGRVAYRPFDLRWSVLHKHILTIRRHRVMSQLSSGGKNVALVASRAVNDASFAHAFVVDDAVDKIFLSSKTSTNAYVFPLFFDHVQLGTSVRRPNLSPTFLKAFCDATRSRVDSQSGLPVGVTAHDILHYIYAVLHSPAYRGRYGEFLRREFPRIPVPGSVDLFSAVAEFGDELGALHLLESSKVSCPITTYTGSKNPEVGRVGWSDGTVWLDASKTNAREGHRAIESGTTGFCGVPVKVWDFHIGGYQVCHKWLKDRKGRTLSKDDIAHYQKIVVALSETIRIMAEIDEVIEAHGGWPDAFHLASAPAEKRPALLMAAESSPPPYVVDKAEPQPVYTRSLPDIERTLRSNRMALPRNRLFTDLDREGKWCAIWCVLHGEGSLPRDDVAVKLCATRLRQSGWADYQRLDPRSDLYREIDDTLKRASRQGNGWLDKPANLHVRAYRRFSEMRDEEWRDCVVKVLSFNDGAAERYVVVRGAFDEARERFGIGRENLVRSVEAPIRSAINSCIRRGYIRREGPERLVLLARYDDPS